MSTKIKNKKHHNILVARLYALAILTTFMLITGCKKEIQKIPGNDDATRSQVSTNVVSCSPVVFGATIGYPGSGLPNRWVTLMQKWYGENGRLSFLKAHFYTEMNDFPMLEHAVEWGALTYLNNNQVYLTDGGQITMRVTVDAQQRPAASYYFHNHFPKGSYLADTSYYHFTGNRLDAIERLYSTSPGVHSQFEKLNFYYDAVGNLVRIERWDPIHNTTPMFFSYDITKPITGMVAVPQITIPLKLLEYMDLLHLPMNDQLTQVSGFGNNWQFNNYSMAATGLVVSYEAQGLNQRTFYTGWNCTSAASIINSANEKGAVNTLADFQRVFGQQK